MKKIKSIAVMLLGASIACGLFSCSRDDVSSEEWVDLGLPSGLLWASCNIGASAPEESGDYYAWGETSTKTVYYDDNYKYYQGYQKITKYCNDPDYGYNGYTDNLTVLEPSDDVANIVLGDGARMPTKEEWKELLDNTERETTYKNGKLGVLLTATNGKSIFIPAAGFSTDHIRNADYEICYRSSSLDIQSPTGCWGYDGSTMTTCGRYAGYNVRAVKMP